MYKLTHVETYFGWSVSYAAVQNSSSRGAVSIRSSSVARGTTNLAGDDWGAVFGLGFEILLTRYLVAGVQYSYDTFTDFNDNTIDADLNGVAVRVGYKF